jgi:glucuronokinase
MPEGRGRAPARAALAGNPSDGYGGAVLAVAVEAFSAQARVTMGADFRDNRDRADGLVDAAIGRFCREFLPDQDPTAIGVQWSTTIPRCVGLGGSSAIVLALLRALCDLHGVSMTADALADLALSIEADDLSIEAGMQDRIAQSYGGVTFMEFGEGSPRYERLPAAPLPPLVLAWLQDAAGPSGAVHGDLRSRYRRGDAVVVESIAELASLARLARAAVLTGDGAELARCADQSFDARARMLELDPRHVAMIELARRHGAGANYTGSGGAVICVCESERHRDAVALALTAAGCSTLSI